MTRGGLGAARETTARRRELKLKLELELDMRRVPGKSQSYCAEWQLAENRGPLLNHKVRIAKTMRIRNLYLQ